MLNLLSLEMNNFYSYENQVIELGKYENEVVIIKGGNGAGKSTIFEAIIWGFTGRTIRKSVELAIINTQRQKQCYVKLTLRTLLRLLKQP